MARHDRARRPAPAHARSGSAATTTTAPTDLAALQREVAVLRDAMATAGAALSSAAGSPGAPVATPDTPARYRIETNAIRKATRTFVQGLVAALPALLLALDIPKGLKPLIPWLPLIALPAVAYAQNKLEDLHLIPPFLRNVGTKDTLLGSAFGGVAGGIGDALHSDEPGTATR